MSSAEMSIGCPNCDDSVVAVATDGGDPEPAFRDPNRLTGTTVDCGNCGDEFEVYFY
jgi:transcription elongation factor Elf1